MLLWISSFIPTALVPIGAFAITKSVTICRWPCQDDTIREEIPPNGGVRQWCKSALLRGLKWSASWQRLPKQEQLHQLLHSYEPHVGEWLWTTRAFPDISHCSSNTYTNGMKTIMYCSGRSCGRHWSPIPVDTIDGTYNSTLSNKVLSTRPNGVK